MKEKEKKKIEQPAPETLEDKDLENVSGGVVRRIILTDTDGRADTSRSLGNNPNTPEVMIPVGAITED